MVTSSTTYERPLHPTCALTFLRLQVFDDNNDGINTRDGEYFDYSYSEYRLSAKS